MTTDRPLVEVPGPTQVGGGPGERLIRLARRRRLVREELLAVSVLLLFLVATVVVLATQWLDSGVSANSAPAPSGIHLSMGGTS
ncbi:MAG TPA: hypothetical protein VFN68_10290 [Acidimicrobiales bacterium]|nr:hypothetical protein [Acidimicrobiales bacterium]